MSKREHFCSAWGFSLITTSDLPCCLDVHNEAQPLLDLYKGSLPLVVWDGNSDKRLLIVCHGEYRASRQNNLFALAKIWVAPSPQTYS